MLRLNSAFVEKSLAFDLLSTSLLLTCSRKLGTGNFYACIDMGRSDI
jgi:hypothetical protein